MASTIKQKFKEIEFGPIPEGWENFCLDKFAELVKDTYLPIKDEELTYIGLEHIDQQTLSLNSVGKSTDVTSNKFRFKDGDILFGKLRPYFRKVYRPKFSGICSTDIWVARAKEGFNQGWLFYLFASEDFVNSASGGSGGTRMPRADWNHLKSTIWSVPPIIEQEQIAEVLSSLDDKIELNRKININLEKIASALFKQWFVVDEDILKKSKVIKLGEVINIVYGKGLPTDQLSDAGYPVFGGNGVIGFHDKYLYKDPQVIIGCRGAGSGNIKQTYPKSFVTNNSLVLEIPNGSILNRFYLKYFLQTVDIKEFVTGSAQPQITIENLRHLEILIPPDETLNKFADVVFGFDQLSLINELESKKLEQVRDSLLPRLMTGKIRTK